MLSLTSSQCSEIIAKVRAIHGDDESQLSVVTADELRILVEAPAGYGKTKTLVSRIAHQIAKRNVSYPKKIMALTFSVNAAYKIRKDVSLLLPEILGTKGRQTETLGSLIQISNYHGLSRRLLSIYGSPYSTGLTNISRLKIVDDSNERDLSSSCGLNEKEVGIMKDFVEAVKLANEKNIVALESQYNDTLIKKILPSGYITYNGLLNLTNEVFASNNHVLEHYRSIFGMFVVDEFQDTNYLAWRIVKKLCSSESGVMLLGDSLQRIYGFIGAIPNLLDRATSELSLSRMSLSKNHRFAVGTSMHMLDASIRRIAEDPISPKVLSTAEVPHKFSGNQGQESDWIANQIKTITEADSNIRVGVLIKGRSGNADKIWEALVATNVGAFWGLFTDEDPTYIRFHFESLKAFNSTIKVSNVFSKKNIDLIISQVQASATVKEQRTFESLSELLKIFLERIQIQNRELNFEQKVELVEDCLVNRSLKQTIEYLSHKVVMTTVHGAKGLEWDYVFIPDMEKSSFPSYYGLCQTCLHGTNCKIQITTKNKDQFLAELSVFYVAATRAKTHLVLSSSNLQIGRNGNNAINQSCFLSLPGIKKRPISNVSELN